MLAYADMFFCEVDSGMNDCRNDCMDDCRNDCMNNCRENVDSAADKQGMRQVLLRQRRQMSAASAAEFSVAIAGRAYEWLLRQDGRRVLSYLAYGREAELGALHEKLWQQGFRVAVPVTDGLPDGVMRAAEYRPGMPLVKTGLGVYEPAGGEVLPPESIDIVLAPGVGFDELGNRLGHGKGYYDRYLPLLHSGAVVVGICYDWQVVERVPVDVYDRSMDVIITEKRLLEFR